ncbi:MAG: galactose mutarotase [Treponema sp.]|nr:galactose mutarotase [Treponema sp.]
MGVELFGTLPNGENVWRCTLKNKGGMSAQIITLGAIIQSIRTADREGNFENVVLGRSDLAGYLAPRSPSAAVIGRVANRIKGHTFQIGGKVYDLAANEGNNTLHGGPGNYGRRNFALVEADDTLVRLALRDHGEAGFPGEVDVEVCYRLNDEGLLIQYRVIPTEDTPLNLTNHVYFNLAGHGSGPINEQELQLEADFYTPADDENIPTGEILRTKGTPFDFSSPRKFGPAIAELAASGDKKGGFDHNFVLNGRGMRKVAWARDGQSGRVMEVFTDLPGMQLFTANHMQEGTPGNDGASYTRHGAFCLETQFFPNTVHVPHFPCCIVPANTVFSSATAYYFRT